MTSRGIKGTRLYAYMMERHERASDGTHRPREPLEARVVDAYLQSVEKPEIASYNNFMNWLHTEATNEQLLLEFNEHELMELLLEEL